MARSYQMLALAALLPLFVACLPASAAQPASPAPAAAPVTASTTASTTTTPQPATPAPAAVAETKQLPATRPGGYRLRKIKGEMAYCREVRPIGTTIPKQECLTPDALDELLKQGQRQANDMLQHLGTCGAAGGNTGCGAN
jgi:hypothetical protein